MTNRRRCRNVYIAILAPMGLDPRISGGKHHAGPLRSSIADTATNAQVEPAHDSSAKTPTQGTAENPRHAAKTTR
jgi:hypothetical protein